MSSESETASSSPLVGAASKIVRLASASRTGSQSSKYRVAQSSSNVSGESLPAQASKAATMRQSAPNVTTFVSFIKRNSSLRPKGAQRSPSSRQLALTNINEPAVAVRADEDRDHISTTETGAAIGEGKLPQKLRHHISRLRLQGSQKSDTAALSSLTNSSPTNSSPANAALNKRASSPSPPRLSVGRRASRIAKRFSIVASPSSAPQYSRQSQKIQLLHEVMKMQSSTATSEMTSQSGASSIQPDSEGEIKPFPFLDLLRPLQNSLSCATLMSEWPNEDEDSEDDIVLESEEAQSERGRSRMLRICCSLDNLLLSIGDRVQKEKVDTEIVRGAARELMQLFQFAVKQVASAAFGSDGRGDDNAAGLIGTGLSPQRPSKETQYAFEFLEEVTDRFGKLDAFVRGTLLGEIDILNERVSALQAECEATKQHNVQLQTEMTDLRDFHSQNGVASLSLRGSNFAREEEDESLGLQLPINSNQRDGASSVSELELLKKQCDEYARVLEMAKQEIRLSHHERDLHKAHVEELSSALFKDSELGMLRSQLQSEKKRVKILEMENVALLQSQHDQALKIQSLLANKSPPTTTTTATAAVHCSAKTSLSSVNKDSGCSIQAEKAAHTDKSALPVVIAPGTIGIDTTSLSYDSVPATAVTFANDVPIAGGVKDERCAHWFSRLVLSISRPGDTDQDATRAGKLTKMAATLPPTALQQTQVRRQANVPTIPPSSLGLSSTPSDNPRPQSSKKRKLKPGANSENTTRVIDKTELEHSCRCLIWFFFQRFLMAQEASMLGKSPVPGGCAFGVATSSADRNPRTSLQFIVYHYFLERASNDKDAIADLSDFVQCLQICRQDSFEVELFCSFLDGRRSHDDLCFLLWVLQAVNDTEVGITYDECAIPPVPLVSGAKKLASEHTQRYVCMLKAGFVVRTIFRLLHFKTAGGKPASPANRKTRPSTAPSRSTSLSSLTKPVSPSSPSKRKVKSRTSDGQRSERSKSQLNLTGGDESSERVTDKATASLRNAIEARGGRPVTLETFNEIFAQFAVVPTADELTWLLGPLYHTTGDEKKVPWEVFIVLLLEMFAHQSRWQCEQLRALFAHLHWQADMDERAATAERKKAEELALLAATTKKRVGVTSNADKEVNNVKKKKEKKRGLAPGNLDSGGEPEAKYLRGLTRPLLTELLRASGIVEDGAHIDIDWLFVQVLDCANQSATEIHFDAVYEALRSLQLLPDWSRRLQMTRHSEMLRDYRPNEFAPALQIQWRRLTSASLAICEEDPNVFVRKQSQQWLQWIDTQLDRISKCPVDAVPSLWHVIESIRSMLSFAWRLASVRSCDGYQRCSERSSTCIALGTCFTELYFADRTVRATIDSFTGFYEPATAVSVSADTLNGSLERFYKTNMMRLGPYLIASPSPTQLAQDSESIATILGHIEHVLQRYSVHLSYLYARHKTASFNCASGVALRNWRQMAYELSLIHSRYLTPFRLQQLFLCVLNPEVEQHGSERTNTLQIDDLALNQSQFVELFVVVAFELHRSVVEQYRKHRRLRKSVASSSISTRDIPQIEDIWKPLLFESGDRGGTDYHHPAQVLSLFLRELVTRMTVRHRSTPHEVSFSQKLSCPLIGQALLEHRAFLRSVFFYYAKQDEDAADLLAASQWPDQPNQTVSASTDVGSASSNFQFQLEKTKRNSMSFDEFQMFLNEFDLVSRHPAPSESQRILTLEDAQRVFQTVMSVDNDDVAQVEFDEFAGAVVALAVFFAPDPFTLWHEKIHAFVSKLKGNMSEDDVRLQY